MAHKHAEGLSLPAFVTSPTELARLRRELVQFDEISRQEGLRHEDSLSTQLPAPSRTLDELARANDVRLQDVAAREQLIAFLADMEARAPVVHVSFAVDPSPAFMQKIVQWFRQNIHANMLVRVGLQPNIAAGCMVRTTNRYYDCSLREHLKRSRAELIRALEVPSAAGHHER